MKSDLHLHSTYSDGSDNISELVKTIESAKLKVVALSDHDTFDGLFELEKQLDDSVRFIKAIELTCLADDIKCHILGYNINTESEPLKELIQKGKVLRRKKLDTRLKFLKDVWNIELTQAEHDWIYSRNSVVKIHVANILVNRGLAKDNLSAMRKYLDNCKTGNTKFDGIEAISVIKQSGGIPVWAHPLGGEGEEHISKELFFNQLEKMKSFGIEGLECYYSRYSIEECEFLADTAKKHNLFISGGSDYHGLNKDVAIGTLNTDGIYIDSDKLTILNSV